jgi:hypothetical protein
MRLFKESDEARFEKDAISFAIGAVGGLALGVLLSRTLPQPRGLGSELRERARTVARRLRPARLRRLAVEQGELDQLEDTVLAGFMGDPLLAERGIDIGAISVGIIELSGSVRTDDESRRAVALANSIPGVNTVVNRLEVENAPRRGVAKRKLDDDELSATFSVQTPRGGGMGTRRQGRETDPDRSDDSQEMREEALERADREQFMDEDFSTKSSRVNQRPEVHANRTNFDEDELDNQDPHGKHAAYTLDSPPEELNSASRVGEAMKPGTALRIEQSGLGSNDGSNGQNS